LPYFEIRNGEMHHPKRYNNNLITVSHFYGTMSENEKETARKLVRANGVNIIAAETKVYFYKTVGEIKGNL
jgi:hypothetical protein